MTNPVGGGKDKRRFMEGWRGAGVCFSDHVIRWAWDDETLIEVHDAPHGVGVGAGSAGYLLFMAQSHGRGKEGGTSRGGAHGAWFGCVAALKSASETTEGHSRQVRACGSMSGPVGALELHIDSLLRLRMRPKHVCEKDSDERFRYCSRRRCVACVC